MMSSTMSRPRTDLAQAEGCEYFYDCSRPAAGLVNHPILGFVRACQTCASIVGLPLEVGLSHKEAYDLTRL